MRWELELGGAQAAALALAVISGALLVIIFVFALRRSRRGTHFAAVPPEELLAAMVRLQGDLPELLRSVDRKLDVKMQVLRELLQQSGETIEALRRLRAGDKPLITPADRPPSTPHAVRPAESEPISRPATGPAEPASLALRKSPEPLTPDPAELRLQRYAHVYSLADTGLDAAEISAETGMHRGEVDLVLSLRRKRMRMDQVSRSETNRHASAPEEATV